VGIKNRLKTAQGFRGDVISYLDNKIAFICRENVRRINLAMMGR